MISLQKVSSRWQRAVHKVFHPDKVNYGAYDTGCHLHFHIVPKYMGREKEWGGTFRMNSQEEPFSQTEYEEMAEAMRQALKEI